MTNTITPETVREALKKATPVPWTAHNMVNEEGRQMTPEEIGEYVANSVRMGSPDRFLFISAKHEDGGDCDVCHIGNGSRGPFNARLIAMAPDLARAYLAAMEENARLENERDVARAWVHRLCASGDQFAAYMHPVDSENSAAHRSEYRKWRALVHEAIKAVIGAEMKEQNND